MAKRYVLKATRRELKVGTCPEVNVTVTDGGYRMVIGDDAVEVFLTLSQVNRLRRIIDRHYPLAASAEE